MARVIWTGTRDRKILPAIDRSSAGGGVMTTEQRQHEEDEEHEEAADPSSTNGTNGQATS